MSEDHAGQDELATKCKFETVWKLLAELGVAHVEVGFDGSNDSGDITDIYYYPPGAATHTQHELMIELQRKVENIDTDIPRDDHGYINPQPGNYTLDELIRALVNDMFNYAEAPDWVNNDGGYGTVHWYVDDDPQRIEVEYSIRIVSTEDISFDYNRFGEQPNE